MDPALNEGLAMVLLIVLGLDLFLIIVMLLEAGPGREKGGRNSALIMTGCIIVSIITQNPFIIMFVAVVVLLIMVGAVIIDKFIKR